MKHEWTDEEIATLPALPPAFYWGVLIHEPAFYNATKRNSAHSGCIGWISALGDGSTYVGWPSSQPELKGILRHATMEAAAEYAAIMMWLGEWS